MARINARLLCELLEDTDEVVLLDQYSGAEITVQLSDLSRLMVALCYFATAAPPVTRTAREAATAMVAASHPVAP